MQEELELAETVQGYVPLNKAVFAALYETLRAVTIACSETSALTKDSKLVDTYHCTGPEVGEV